MTFFEYSSVILKCPLASLGLKPGVLGVVVHTYGTGAAYEIEFLSSDGNTFGVATVAAADLLDTGEQSDAKKA